LCKHISKSELRCIDRLPSRDGSAEVDRGVGRFRSRIAYLRVLETSTARSDLFCQTLKEERKVHRFPTKRRAFVCLMPRKDDISLQSTGQQRPTTPGSFAEVCNGLK